MLKIYYLQFVFDECEMCSHVWPHFTPMSLSESNAQLAPLLRDFPDHATFREKGAKLAFADKLGVFLSLTLCNKANFDPLQI